MVYQIYYGGIRPRKVLFDIEYYLAFNERHKSKDDEWYVELHSSSFVSGAVDFIWNVFTGKDKYEWREFIEKKIYDFAKKYGVYVNVD